MSTFKFYQLDANHQPILCDHDTWAGCDPQDRRVGRYDQDGINIKEPILVSTVFLGFARRFLDDDGPPILFETMIFGGKHDHYQERYTTWDDAVAGHKRAVRRVKNA